MPSPPILVFAPAVTAQPLDQVMAEFGAETISLEQAVLKGQQQVSITVHNPATAAAGQVMMMALLGMVIDMAAAKLALDHQTQAFQELQGTVNG
jgi:hypothetical protein